MRKLMVLLMVGVFMNTSASDAKVIKPRLHVETAGANLVDPEAWEPWEAGFEKQNGVITCDNGADTDVQRGAGQVIELNQEIPQPVVAAAWSRADGVTGARDRDYSLYLDIVYTDGTPQWGQISAFNTGTHDWEKREVLFVPSKAIASVHIYVLLRRHGGKAWFRDISLRQIETPAGSLTFDGIPIAVPRALPQEGFQVVDVAAGSDICSFEEGRALGLTLQSERSTDGRVTTIDARIRDTTGRDRAVTLYYAVRLPPAAYRWLQDPRREEKADGTREYSHTTRYEAGANGRFSLYPFAAACSDALGTALGIDLFTPVFSRNGFNAGTNELFVACDIGLTPEKPEAEVRFCLFNFDPEWGFRSALATLYAAYPEAFRRRVERQGLWMPFAKISEVERWEDFGFVFKEGNNETAWDDAHGITTFRYTEPMTWWMRMPKETPRTIDAALGMARTLVREKPDTADGRKAHALLTSGFHDENGNFVAQLRDTPWCDGAVWSMNAMPGIEGEFTDFSLKWNGAVRASLYGPEREGDLDGEYVDSSEGYVTAVLNFRRDHFAAAATPLTFSPQHHRPAIFRGLVAAEYVRALARDVHGMGKLMMANSTPSRIWFLAPYLDIMGSETNWNPGGTWRPMSDAAMLYRRALSGPKPYCFLQNSVFEDFSHEKVERYMKRSLAYGMFPGFFSHNASQGHYFRRPELYNRDRDLFKTYIPLCRKVAEAGWQPVTNARVDDEEVYVERFGEDILTVFNDSQQSRTVQLSLSIPGVKHAVELLHDRQLGIADEQGRQVISLALGPEDVAVLQLHATK